MNKLLKTIFICVLFTLSIGTVSAMAADKIEAPAACERCRMSRTMFNYSRMLVTYADGSTAGTCSLNCMVDEFDRVKGKKIKLIQVADYNTKALINAKTATWVIGGSKRGVMTAVAKWAFAKKQDAREFVNLNGGKLATFKEAYEMAEKEPQHRD